MKPRKHSFLHWATLAIAGLASTLLLHGAEILNPGFSSGTANWTAVSDGTFKAGNEGGNGWNTTWMGGSYPTNNTFATSFSKSPMRQNLTGADNTFVAGATYTVTAQLFGTRHVNYPGSAIMWSLGITADGAPVAIDHWFSDEYTSQTVSNSGPIPNDHIITVNTSSSGLTTATVTFTATAAEAGKIIGVQIGGNSQSKYPGVTGATDGWYGFMDSLTFASTVPTIETFVSDKTVVDGAPVTLSWNITYPESITTLTINDGTGETNVLPFTSMEDGYGSTEVNPTANTTYTLTVNGAGTRQVTVVNGKVFAFNSTKAITLGPDFQTTLSWDVRPIGATVSISDGTNTVDVTANTENGLGSRVFTVPSASTNYTISVNDGSGTASIRVLRAVESNAIFSINSNAIVTGSPVITSWNGSNAASGSWIGVYSKHKTPGPMPSDQWAYISGNTGSMQFTLPVGDYFAILFADGGYTIEQGPIYFTVADAVIVDDTIRVTSLQRSTDPVAGEQMAITWESKADHEYDIYASPTLEGDPQTDWTRVGFAVQAAGATTTFTEDLPEPTPARRFYKIYEFESSN